MMKISEALQRLNSSLKSLYLLKSSGSHFKYWQDILEVILRLYYYRNSLLTLMLLLLVTKKKTALAPSPVIQKCSGLFARDLYPYQVCHTENFISHNLKIIILPQNVFCPWKSGPTDQRFISVSRHLPIAVRGSRVTPQTHLPKKQRLSFGTKTVASARQEWWIVHF